MSLARIEVGNPWQRIQEGAEESEKVADVLRLKRSRSNQPTNKISKGVSETDEEIIGPQ